MGRELKRVPLDFDYPLKNIWYGYFIKGISTCFSSDDKNYCKSCVKMAEIKGLPFTSYGCPDFYGYFEKIINELSLLCEVPEGEGYQLWETTSEGSPISPVFETLEALCEWCEDNATVFADIKVSKERWFDMLSDNYVMHKEGNVVFI